MSTNTNHCQQSPDFVISQRQELESELGAKLSEWGDEIDALAGRMERARYDLRVRLREDIELLKQQRADARAKLDELRRSSGSAWEDLKDGLERAWSDIHVTLEQAKARYDNDTRH